MIPQNAYNYIYRFQGEKAWVLEEARQGAAAEHGERGSCQCRGLRGGSVTKKYGVWSTQSLWATLTVHGCLRAQRQHFGENRRFGASRRWLPLENGWSDEGGSGDDFGSLLVLYSQNDTFCQCILG